MKKKISAEQMNLLRDIGIIDFVIVEMNLYLDTHPHDKEAIEYVRHYIRMKNQALQDYATKYSPLTVYTADLSGNTEWKWATQPLPWEGV